MKLLSWLLISVAVVLAFSSSASAENPVVCSFCQFAVQLLDGFVELNYTQSQIIGLADTLCAAAPPEIQKACDLTFQTYLPPIIKDLQSGMSAQAICAQGGLCSPPAGQDEVLEVKETQPLSLSAVRYN